MQQEREKKDLHVVYVKQSQAPPCFDSYITEEEEEEEHKKYLENSMEFESLGKVILHH